VELIREMLQIPLRESNWRSYYTLNAL